MALSIESSSNRENRDTIGTANGFFHRKKERKNGLEQTREKPTSQKFAVKVKEIRNPR